MKIPINISSGKIESKNQKNIIVGIDLGTTNSLVAYIKNDSATAMSGNDKEVIVPSLIYFDSDDNPHVGASAKSHIVSDPNRTIYSVKRLLGKSFKDIEEKDALPAYTIIDDAADENQLVKVRVGDKYYSPIYLSSLILAELKKRAEAELGQEISQAVISVPAYFNDAQRQATRDAGKLAGLDVLRIVNEPTAASLAYGIGLDRSIQKKVAVYDLGGGTFDISILHIEDGIFEVLSTHGDTFLGGDDFDKAIIQYWKDKHTSLDIPEHHLRTLAEEAKIYLTDHTDFKADIDSTSLTLSRDELNTVITPIINKTMQACIYALNDAQLSIKDIDAVVMVGGSTRTPLVKEMVSTFFAQEVNDSINPDEVVALGAAIQADVLAGNRKDVLLLDVTPLSLGIETVGGLMDTLIPRNSKVPTRVGRSYTTSVDGQANLKIAVYQGERDLVAHNRKLGEFILKDIPPMPAGIPQIEIQFLLDADGILTVKAMEKRSNTASNIVIKSTYGVSEEEMGKMLLDSIKHAQSDMDKRSLVETINEANNIILSTDKFLDNNASLLSDQEKKTILEYRDQLKEATQGESKDAIQQIMDELNTYSRPIAEMVLEKSVASALKNTKI